MRESLTVFLAAALAFQPAISSRAQASHTAVLSGPATSEVPSLKEQALRIPPQSFVEVRLQSKEKVRGWLAGVTDAGLTLRVAKGDRVATLELGFSEVKSIKVTDSKGSKAGKVALGVLAGFGALVLVFVVVCKTTEACGP
jgi:hypothetical protein